jgi:hypothetical protein
MKLNLPGASPELETAIGRLLRQIFAFPIRLASYVVAGLPAAADYTGGIIYVSNEAGGATLAFSDGTNWRRVQDRAVVS